MKHDSRHQCYELKTKKTPLNIRLIVQKKPITLHVFWCLVLLVSEFCLSVITKCCGCLLHVHMQVAELQKHNKDLIMEMDKVMTELEKTRPGKAKKKPLDADESSKV